MLIMVSIPNSTDFALVVFKLMKLFKQTTRTFCLWLILPRPPQIPQPIDEDLAKPIAKRAGLLIMVELRKLLYQNGKHFLDQIVGVRFLHVILQ